jgi:hypothetical protein
MRKKSPSVMYKSFPYAMLQSFSAKGLSSSLDISATGSENEQYTQKAVRFFTMVINLLIPL